MLVLLPNIVDRVFGRRTEVQERARKGEELKDL